MKTFSKKTKKKNFFTSRPITKEGLKEAFETENKK